VVNAAHRLGMVDYNLTALGIIWQGRLIG